MTDKPAQPPRGMRDLSAPEMRRRDYVCRTLRDVFEAYGFEPLDTPALEYRDTLYGKYGPDAERLIYDAGLRGDADLALRYDLSVPLARFAATADDLSLPYRRYQVSKVWRGERPQRGRYREFTQADVDIVGSHSMLADAEIIALVVEIADRLGFSGCEIKVNNRKVLSALGRYTGVPDALLPGLYRSIDKLDKVGADGVRLELLAVGLSADLLNRQRQGVERWLRGTADRERLATDLAPAIPSDAPAGVASAALPAYLDALEAAPAGSGLDGLEVLRHTVMTTSVDALRAAMPDGAVIPQDVVERLMSVLDADVAASERMDDLEARLDDAEGAAGFCEVREVFAALDALGLPRDQVRFDPAMVRGLEYYTGTIFETIVTDPPIGSLTGGGRFDGLTGLFGRDLPAVGTTFGVDRIVDVMTAHELFPESVSRPGAQVLVARFDEAHTPDALRAASALRRAGLSVEQVLDVAPLGEQIRYALRRKVPLVAIVGPDEVARGAVTMRDLGRESQQTVPLDHAATTARQLLGGG